MLRLRDACSTQYSSYSSSSPILFQEYVHETSVQATEQSRDEHPDQSVARLTSAQSAAVLAHPAASGNGDEPVPRRRLQRPRWQHGNRAAPSSPSVPRAEGAAREKTGNGHARERTKRRSGERTHPSPVHGSGRTYPCQSPVQGAWLRACPTRAALDLYVYTVWFTLCKLHVFRFTADAKRTVASREPRAQQRNARTD